MAEEELLVGVVVDVVEVEDEDAVPVLPLVPVVPASADELFAELRVFVVAMDFEEEDVASPEARTAVAPGRSWATTTPSTTVAPAAVTIAPRVSMRRRDWALSRSLGVLGWLDSDMW